MARIRVKVPYELAEYAVAESEGCGELWNLVFLEKSDFVTKTEATWSEIPCYGVFRVRDSKVIVETLVRRD